MVPNVYQIVYKLELFTLMYCLQKVVAKPSLVFTALESRLKLYSLTLLMRVCLIHEDLQSYQKPDIAFTYQA